MRVTNLATTLALSLVRLAAGQTQASLETAVAQYPELSTFRTVLAAYPGLLPSILVSLPAGQKLTVLVPTNNAIATYLTASNRTSLAQLPPAQLQILLQYHVVEAALTAADITASPGGTTPPTVLKDPAYNNRTAGAEMIARFGPDATGAVLFVRKDPIPGVAKFRIRAVQPAGGASLRAGLGQTTTLNVIDGTWDGGYFQTVDAVLSPPMPCSSTIQSQSALGSLDTALKRSGLYPALDHAPNVTCLAPDTSAFNAAGSPESSLDPTTLGNALLFHTLPEVTYTNFLVDGMQITSLANLTVTVRIIDGNIYFNDAKVISPNVITNNGLIHVLDKVMTPNGTAPGTSSSNSSSTTTTPKPTSSPTAPTSFPTPTQSGNAAASVSGSQASFGLLAFFVAVAALV